MSEQCIPIIIVLASGVWPGLTVCCMSSPHLLSIIVPERRDIETRHCTAVCVLTVLDRILF